MGDDDDKNVINSRQPIKCRMEGKMQRSDRGSQAAIVIFNRLVKDAWIRDTYDTDTNKFMEVVTLEIPWGSDHNQERQLVCLAPWLPSTSSAPSLCEKGKNE